MNIKIDVTKVTVYTHGVIHIVIIPGIFKTRKDVKPFLDNYFKDSYKIVDSEKCKNVLIPVVMDSVTQSIYEYFDSVVILNADDTLIESEVE